MYSFLYSNTGHTTIGLEQALMNVDLSNNIYRDTDHFLQGDLSSPFLSPSAAPRYAVICVIYPLIVPLVTKGIHTRNLWKLVLGFLAFDDEFCAFMEYILDQYNNREAGKQLKMWFRQKLRSGFYFSEDVSNLLTDDFFRSAKFYLVVVYLRAYINLHGGLHREQ